MPPKAFVYLVRYLRKLWRWTSEERKQIKREVKACASCSTPLTSKTVKVDHIDPVGKQPRTLTELLPYIARMFCPLSNLQGLCKPCHRRKTTEETKARAALRRASKKGKSA